MNETMNLIQRAHEGDKEARNRLVTENAGLVWSIVRRYQNRGRGCEMEDLFQIGTIGLIKAIDKFDMGYQVQFSTYAVPMIAGEIKRFLRDDGMIKVSRSLKDMGLRIKLAREELMGEMARDPTIDEIAKKLEVSREEVAASIGANAEVESIYSVCGKSDENSMYLIDKLKEEGEGAENILDRMMLKEALLSLEERERQIIIKRYFYNQTQSEIAAGLGISQVQVSRLEKKSLRQMRGTCEPIGDY